MQIAHFTSGDRTLLGTPHLKGLPEILTISPVSGIDRQTALPGTNVASGRKQQRS